LTFGRLVSLLWIYLVIHLINKLVQFLCAVPQYICHIKTEWYRTVHFSMKTVPDGHCSLPHRHKTNLCNSEFQNSDYFNWNSAACSTQGASSAKRTAFHGFSQTLRRTKTRMQADQTYSIIFTNITVCIT